MIGVYYYCKNVISSEYTRKYLGQDCLMRTVRYVCNYSIIYCKQYLPAIIQLAHKTNIQSKPKHINCKIHKTQPVK